MTVKAEPFIEGSEKDMKFVILISISSCFLIFNESKMSVGLI